MSKYVNSRACAATLAALELCDVSVPGLDALMGTLPASFSSDRSKGTYKAPRVNNDNPHKPTLTINGRILRHIIVDTGCEMVVLGRKAARNARIKPSMMRLGAVALRCANERVTKAFDRTINLVPFVFNPGTANKTTVIAHIVVTNSDTDTVLLGMSVIGRVGLAPLNPYKGTLKYYVDWDTRGSRSARLACTFPIEIGKRKIRTNSPAFEVIEGWLALTMPKDSVPTSDLECHETRLRYQTYGRQLLNELVQYLSQSMSTLAQADPEVPMITHPEYCHLSPFNQDLVDIVEPAEHQGLIVVELCGGILAATEALVRVGVKIRQLHVCELDPVARLIAAERLEVLGSLFPDLLPRTSFAQSFATLPHDIRAITNDHLHQLGHVDLVICGFPCQGFSRASRKARGLQDPRSSVFLDMVHVLHQITRVGGDCGWVVENVDASDHPDLKVREEFNQVVKGVLGEGIAFDAVAVGSYAHRFRRFWTNLIPTTILSTMVGYRFANRLPTQSVQDILEPNRWAQLAHHDRAPGPHSVNEVGKPLKAFATFLTTKDSDAYRAQAQSLVLVRDSTLEPPSILERERAMGFLGGTSQCHTRPLSEASRLKLLGGSMDLYQLTFLFGAALAFQNNVLANWRLQAPAQQHAIQPGQQALLPGQLFTQREVT